MIDYPGSGPTGSPQPYGANEMVIICRFDPELVVAALAIEAIQTALISTDPQLATQVFINGQNIVGI